MAARVLVAIALILFIGWVLPLVPGLRGADQGFMMTLNSTGQFVWLVIAGVLIYSALKK